MPELIPLSNGGYALVDREDVPIVSGYVWRIQYRYYKGKRLNPSAVVASTPNGIIKMHRLLTDAPDGMVVDHKNGLALNNTRANLRVCTNAENLRNRKRASSNKSGVKGVYVDCKSPSKGKRWRAEIQSDGKSQHLGRFRSKAEAAAAYRSAAKRLHGEFARFD